MTVILEHPSWEDIPPPGDEHAPPDPDADRLPGYPGVARPTLPSSTLIPDEFWEARPELDHIRRAAHSRQRSAPAVLHAVLARVAAATPHTIKLPPIVGSAAPLTYFVAAVAPSGVGKSTGNDIAAEVFPVGGHVADQLPIGTGEGLAEVLFDIMEETDPKTNKLVKVKVQVRHNAFVYVDEGQLIANLGGRDGSSLLPTLRSIWTGGTIGQTNASKERKRIVPAGQYAFGIVAGLQSTKAGALLDDADGGTPQRFAWTLASDPTIPDVLPPWPGRLMWEPPRPHPDDYQLIGGFNVALMEVTGGIASEIRVADLGRARGAVAVDPLDGHGGLLQLKIAGLLAVLNGRLDIDEDDWALAGMMKRSSDAVRTELVHLQKTTLAQRESEFSRRLASRAVESAGAVERRRTVDCARKIAAKVWAEPDRWTRRTLLQDMRRYRDVYDDGLSHAVAEAWVAEVDVSSHTGDDKRALCPGKERLS